MSLSRASALHPSMTRFPHFYGRRACLALAGRIPALLLAASHAGSRAKCATPERILLVTLTKGFRHDSIPVAQDSLRRLGEEQGWEMDLAATDDDVSTKIRSEALGRF